MKILSIIIVIISMFFSNNLLASTAKLEMVEQEHAEIANYLVRLIDTKTGKALTEDDLKEVNTKKLHLLVIEPSLTEYHRLQPVYQKDGVWNVGFVPKKVNKFRVWADFTRADTGNQEFIMTDIEINSKIKVAIDKTVKTVATVGEYKFNLSLDGELKAGQAVKAKLTITKNGKPFKKLQPVMGAFAHIVGFGDDYKTIMHIHPMGKEPTSEKQRGGDVLEFHLEPEKAGFVKLFAQLRIDGKDVFAPFGIMVK